MRPPLLVVTVMLVATVVILYFIVFFFSETRKAYAQDDRVEQIYALVEEEKDHEPEVIQATPLKPSTPIAAPIAGGAIMMWLLGRFFNGNGNSNSED